MVLRKMKQTAEIQTESALHHLPRQEGHQRRCHRPRLLQRLPGYPRQSDHPPHHRPITYGLNNKNSRGAYEFHIIVSVEEPSMSAS
ncbi:hypothetical protein M407DRAFT_233021 [Tulasnella calospora MUT 4182]|uniref:Uncharacterized protein n=1 Tax=Tulasnella calospora MUT 4182 TaxID=1051891 RepID=A0A0C3L394_9AGAM|nr:hypothetical protein M407DRAFT_233021 [Tulasnella calospora MUT 4182]